MMQFDPTGMSPLVEVRWYFVPRGTPGMPFPTAFGSTTTWEPEREWDSPLGEQYMTKKIRVSRPGPVARPTRHPCGTEDQWLNGVVGGWVNPPAGPDGVPRCCDAAILMGRGRLLELGGAFVGPRHFYGSGLELAAGLGAFAFGHEYSGGGLELALGTSPLNRRRSYYGSGPELEGGAGQLLSRRLLGGSGGELESGAGKLLSRRTYGGSGGELLYGFATLTRRVPYLGTGLCLEAGAASLLSRRKLLGSGGELEAGTAAIVSARVMRGSGVEREPGAGSFLSRRVLKGSGSELEGGIGKLLSVRVLKGSGLEYANGGSSFLSQPQWTFLQQNSAQAVQTPPTGTTTTVALFPTTPGNLLVLCYFDLGTAGGSGVPTSVLDGRGNAMAAGATRAAGGLYCRIYYLVVPSSGSFSVGPSVTLGAITANNLVTIWAGEFVGSGPFRVHGSDQGTTLPAAPGSLTPHDVNGLFVAGACCKTIGGIWSLTAGWQLYYGAGATGSAVAWAVGYFGTASHLSGGPQNPSFGNTGTGTQTWLCDQSAFSS